MNLDSWSEIARRQQALRFRREENPGTSRVPGLRISVDLPRRLPQVPPRSARQFEDLDYFCSAYKMIFAKSVGPLKREIARILGREETAEWSGAASPY